ncbi:hypothetical protein fugu_015940 [Takifugu bimaculatus]|uniref:MCM AAA-lid domain-containing protein n=1 Tax=Takifugu bimaculatus TaxID=433685 RepID=A0A4Z2BVY1_9TELE|nr:hypothetical protein fugu_015940 [Takifugu bimaculatus]
MAVRGVRHQATGEMFASLSRDEHGAGTANIHAGSALLATGGICMLGGLGLLQKRKTRHHSDLGAIPTQLADAFGLIIESRDTKGDHSLFTQTIHTLQQAVQPGNHLYSHWQFSAQDYKELVAHARSLEVELSPEAEKIIHGYYMASRRVRTQTHGFKMSVGSVKLLISLAEAHCKLSLRTQVLQEDAVIAVLLCENSVTLKHGASALVIPPHPVFPFDLGGADSLQKRDAALDELHQNILRFIYAYAPGAEMFITEE